MANSCKIGPKFLSLALAKRVEKEAAKRGVSSVARSRRGFMTMWKTGKLTDWWCNRRANFLKRHMAQVSGSKEDLWKNGAPTRRHLALVMWAWSPNSKKLANWLKSR
jgi:hypothetical protein